MYVPMLNRAQRRERRAAIAQLVASGHTADRVAVIYAVSPAMVRLAVIEHASLFKGTPTPGEAWRQVDGYPYEVSDHGRVRRTVRRSGVWSGRILRQAFDGHGYPFVVLCRDGQAKQIKVHKLVLAAFVGPRPSPKHQCNHRDGNKRNNVLANLEYVTASENVRHAWRTGLHRRRERFSDPPPWLHRAGLTDARQTAAAPAA